MFRIHINEFVSASSQWFQALNTKFKFWKIRNSCTVERIRFLQVDAIFIELFLLLQMVYITSFIVDKHVVNL